MGGVSAPTAVQRWMVMGMYESPIKIIESAMDSITKSLVKEKEDAIILAVKRQLGVDVDRGELLQALQYDRFQYDKGYADGHRDAMDKLVRCKDCKHWNKRYETKGICLKHNSIVTFTSPEFYCACGERREGE